MSEDVLHRSPDLTYHEMRVMDIIAPRLRVGDYASVEDVDKLQILEAAEVMRCIREAGLVIGPSINGHAELACEDIERITVCITCKTRPARAERDGSYYCGHCLLDVLRRS